MPEQLLIDKSKFNNLLNSKNLLSTRTATEAVDTTEYIYQGSADPGSSKSDPKWLIQRTGIYADGSTDTLFANGKIAFDQVWDNRASLTYT